MTPRSMGWVILVFAVLASCTTEAVVREPHAARLTGELVTVSATQASSSLVVYPLSGSAVRSVRAPIDPEAVNRSTVVGSTAPDGTLLLTSNRRATRAYSFPVDGEETVALGPPLDVRASDEPLLSISAAGALVATCGGAWVLPLPAADGWLRVDARCWAALSPDGRSVAFTRDGRQVLGSRLGEPRTHVLFDLADLSPALGRVTPRPSLIGTAAWSSDGLAFLVRAGDQFAAFVRLPSGKLVEVLQEPYANVFRVPRLAWRPGGGLLAIADDVGPSGAVLRVYDVSTATLDAVSLAPVGYAGLGWAPDGTRIALLTGAGHLLVVSLDGTWQLSRETDWDELIGWSPG